MSTTSAVFQLSKLGCRHVDSIVHLPMPILLPRLGVVFAFVVEWVCWYIALWAAVVIHIIHCNCNDRCEANTTREGPPAKHETEPSRGRKR